MRVRFTAGPFPVPVGFVLLTASPIWKEASRQRLYPVQTDIGVWHQPRRGWCALMNTGGVALPCNSGFGGDRFCFVGFETKHAGDNRRRCLKSLSRNARGRSGIFGMPRVVAEPRWGAGAALRGQPGTASCS